MWGGRKRNKKMENTPKKITYKGQTYRLVESNMQDYKIERTAKKIYDRLWKLLDEDIADFEFDLDDVGKRDEFEFVAQKVDEPVFQAINALAKEFGFDKINR